MGQILQFDPTGARGANPAVVLPLTSCASLPGTYLARDEAHDLAVGKAFTASFQFILGSLNTAGSFNGTVMCHGDTGEVFMWEDDGTLADVAKQFILVGELGVVVKAISGNLIKFGFDPTKASLVVLRSQSVRDRNGNPVGASINDGSGRGIAPSMLPFDMKDILSGHIIPDGFTSSFVTYDGPPVALNQHGGGSGTYAGVGTATGSGNSSLSVVVDSFSRDHFLIDPASNIVTIKFNTVTLALPFRACDPPVLMWDSYAPQVGPTNGVDGPDVLSTSQTNFDFEVA